jgi:chemotaxis regulatin CheY-phosphate phosphatase CheZ
MPNDSSTAAALPAPLDGHPTPSEADYEAIQAAVLETWRGRWFLTEYARRNRHADTSVVLAAIERIEATIRRERDTTPLDRFRFDIMEMAKAISRTKEEIAAIQPDPDHHGRIEEATEQLDSVVAATERATSDILAAAEQVQEVAWTMREHGLDPGICDQLDARATDVYTACSFQDLTGQRISKVVAAMRYLEGRINAMVEIWGDGAADADASEYKAKKDPLVNGPARPGHGLDQADVDVMMSNETPAAVWEAAATEPAATIDHEPAPAGAATPAPTRASSPADAAPALVPAAAPEPPPVPTALPPVEMMTAAPAVPAPAAATPPPAPPKPAPLRAPADPLAPVAALSEEEKIALFT